VYNEFGDGIEEREDSHDESDTSEEDSDHENLVDHIAIRAFQVPQVEQSTSASIPTQPTVSSRVLKDIFHLMDLIKITSRHGLKREFSSRLRDALFVMDAMDVERVKRVLDRQGISFAKKLQTNPAWILRRVRRVVPPPQVLYPVIKNLFDQYGGETCARTGLPLFDRKALAKAVNVLKAIQDGHVSDPPGVSFYFEIGVDRDNLPVYRCSRGTNSVEGGIHQNIIRKFGAFGASPHLADCAMADYRLRHNTDVSFHFFSRRIIIFNILKA
jgi:hypothetical protein